MKIKSYFHCEICWKANSTRHEWGTSLIKDRWDSLQEALEHMKDFPSHLIFILTSSEEEYNSDD